MLDCHTLPIIFSSDFNAYLKARAAQGTNQRGQMLMEWIVTHYCIAINRENTLLLANPPNEDVKSALREKIHLAHSF